MADSNVIVVDGQPRLCVEGEIVPACAYVTYFDERNRYEEFAAAGYTLFSVTVALASRPINSGTGFTPYQKGVFDREDAPDFTCVDEAIGRIVAACPEAKIFPRVYVTMPTWWCEKHPQETLPTPDGEVRELLFSEPFRTTGCAMLRQVIQHIRQAPYAPNIIGYHLAGGCTEEWFHFGRDGALCPNSKSYFTRYLQAHYPTEEYDGELPDKQGLYEPGEITDRKLRRYLEFSNVEVAETIACFAKAVKEAVDYRQTVGVFYGYTMDICSGLLGDLAIDRLLTSPDIDFFCSPNSYYNDRALGVDWGDMIASGSVKSHGKICFLECDVRTSLSDYINNCRPGADKNNLYYGPVWLGPQTVEGSVAAMRKSFAHQLTRGNGMWWFDMWGGWYDHPAYMREAKRCLELYGQAAPAGHGYKPEIALFVDGELYQRQGVGSPLYRAPFDLKNAFGNSGVPYELYLLGDFEQHYRAYKAVAFPVPVSSPRLERAMALCEAAGIPYLRVDAAHPTVTPGDVRAFAAAAGACIFCDTDDVICAGNGFVAIHAASAGDKVIRLPAVSRVRDVYAGEEATVTDRILLTMQAYDTALYAVEEL